MDDRLIIPKNLQTPIKNSLHWGHPGRDQMLMQIIDIWWPKIHRDVTLLTKTCPECRAAGKSSNKTNVKSKTICQTTITKGSK